MNNQILTLAKDLIAIPSVSGEIEESVAILELAKKQLAEYPFTPFASNSIPSLLYSNKGKDIKDFKIILNTHLDVVPADEQQFHPFERDGKLLGRGSYDTKAAGAAMIFLFKELAHTLAYPLALQITTDEEMGGENGTGYQIERGIRGDFVIASECGSNFSIVHEAKSRLVVKLIANGKTSHSAYPWLGENAIWKLQQTIHSILQHYPPPAEEAYRTTVNITRMQTQGEEKSEVAYNRTPDYCEALLDVRYVPAEKDLIVAQLQSLLTEGVEMQILHNTVPHQTDANNSYIKILQEVGAPILRKKLPVIKQHATSDVRLYSAVGCDGIEFGPIGKNQHAEEEWVDIKSLEQYYHILKTFLLSLK